MIEHTPDSQPLPNREQNERPVVSLVGSDALDLSKVISGVRLGRIATEGAEAMGIFRNGSGFVVRVDSETYDALKQL